MYIIIISKIFFMTKKIVHNKFQCECSLCFFSSNLVRRHRLLFFFFSSRRRHTRLQGDWSSDVCSSDLSPRNPVVAAAVRAAAEKAKRAFRNRQTQPERFLVNRAAGVNFRELRIASMSGVVRIEWDGATTSWRLVEPPTEAAEPARLELARRFLRSVGPSTPQEFAWWSGGWAGSYGASTRGELSDAQQTFRSLEKELTEVDVAGRKQWSLRTDRVRLERAVPVETVRLLPAGDPFLASADRALLVPQPRFRSELWPNSVWPGALLVNGDLVGTWRRQVGRVTVRAWRPLEPEVKEAVEEEVSRMPIESATKKF